MSLVVAHVTFLFLSMLPVKETLAVRGHRLQDTPHQRQNKVYAPDIRITVQVEDPACRLQANFVDDRHLLLCHGEWRQMDFWLQNCGPTPIGEVWLVTRPDEEVWVGPAGDTCTCSRRVIAWVHVLNSYWQQILRWTSSHHNSTTHCRMVSHMRSIWTPCIPPPNLTRARACGFLFYSMHHTQERKTCVFCSYIAM